jgi:hypothetical protein
MQLGGEVITEVPRQFSLFGVVEDIKLSSQSPHLPATFVPGPQQLPLLEVMGGWRLTITLRCT